MLFATSSKSEWIKRLSWLSLGGLGYFSGSVALLHLLRPDYDPISRFISEYAVGDYSPLMTSAFEALGFGTFALTTGLYLDSQSFRKKHFPKGLILLGLWSGSVVIVGLFPTDLKGQPFSKKGVIHGLAAMTAFVSQIGAAFLFSNSFKSEQRWQPLQRPSSILAYLTLIAFVTFLASPSAFKGITERLLVVLALAWLSLVSLELRKAQ